MHLYSCSMRHHQNLFGCRRATGNFALEVRPVRSAASQESDSHPPCPFDLCSAQQVMRSLSVQSRRQTCRVSSPRSSPGRPPLIVVSFSEILVRSRESQPCGGGVGSERNSSWYQTTPCPPRTTRLTPGNPRIVVRRERDILLSGFTTATFHDRLRFAAS